MDKRLKTKYPDLQSKFQMIFFGQKCLNILLTTP